MSEIPSYAVPLASREGLATLPPTRAVRFGLPHPTTSLIGPSNASRSSEPTSLIRFEGGVPGIKIVRTAQPLGNLILWFSGESTRTKSRETNDPTDTFRFAKEVKAFYDSHTDEAIGEFFETFNGSEEYLRVSAHAIGTRLYKILAFFSIKCFSTAHLGKSPAANGHHICIKTGSLVKLQYIHHHTLSIHRTS